MSDQLPANSFLNLSVKVSDSDGAASLTGGRSATDNAIAEDSDVFAAQLSSALQSAKDKLDSQHEAVEQEETRGDVSSLLDAAVLHRSMADGVQVGSNNPDSPDSEIIRVAVEPDGMTGVAGLASHDDPAAAELLSGTVQTVNIEGVELSTAPVKAQSALDSVRRGLDMPASIVNLPTTDASESTDVLAVQSGQLRAESADELTDGKALLSLPPGTSGRAPDSDSRVNANGLPSVQLQPGGTPLATAVKREVSSPSPLESASGEVLTVPVSTSKPVATDLLSVQEQARNTSITRSATAQTNTDGAEGDQVVNLASADLLSADAEPLTAANDKAALPGNLQNTVKIDQQVTSGVTSQVTPMAGALEPLSPGVTESSGVAASFASNEAKPLSRQADVTDPSSAFDGLVTEPGSLETETKTVAFEAGQSERSGVLAEIGSKASQDGFSEPANMFHATASGIVAAPVSQRSEPVVALPVAPQLVSLSADNADEAMLDNVRWMIGENVRSATVNVTPAGMGQISIKVDMESEQVSVSIVAGQGATREALDAALPRLREQLILQGHESVRVDISDGRSDHSRTNDENRRFMGGSNNHVTGEEGEREAYAAGTEQRPVQGRSRGLVDAYA